MSAAQLRRIISAALLCATALPAWGNEKPLLSASTENSTPGEIRPSPELVRIVLDSVGRGNLEQLDACVAAQRLKHADYASLLRAVRISGGAGHALWFVRPSLNPYCQVLYGAHLFQYFLVDEQPSASRSFYRLVYQNGGDSFDIYGQKSHGLNDIGSTGCVAIECRSSRMSFDGRQYQPVQCSRTRWNDHGQEVTESRRCGADDWKNSQSSGFAPSSDPKADIEKRVIESLNAAAPTASWDHAISIMADITCSGHPSTVVVSQGHDAIWLGIVNAGMRIPGKPIIVNWPISPGNQSAFCSQPVHITTYPHTCQGNDGPLPGCKPAPGCVDISIEDDQCDPMNGYWNNRLGTMSWWRN